MLLVFYLLALFAEPTSTDDGLSARQIIDRAVEAAGGESWKRPQTLMLKGSMTIYPNGQRDDALSVDDYRMWRIFPDRIRPGAQGEWQSPI